GIARAYRRGHGADPACLEGTATLRLARKALPLPDVLVWPKPLQQPLPPIYALGTSSEASDFAARNHVGLGVSFGPFDAMGKVTAYFKDQCARHGWQPEPHQIIYRANILIAATGDKAQQALAQYPRQ